MANGSRDDPLPVKEGSCLNTCRSSIIDARERHIVCKLDRYQLEDRYLRLLDEVIHLKKLSNSQEDKIKRLATKLMRVAATPRSCLAPALDTHNDKNRVDHLEHENAKLKERITVLRSQILNHKLGRSRSRTRRPEIYTPSGLGTFRSELGQVESRSSHLVGETDDAKDRQNNLGKIEELELQKSEMASKIADLESQLENNKVEKQREKAAENVEFIRIWRQMKQRSEELVSAQAANASLVEQISDLKELLEEKTRNYKEINGALMVEKQKLAEMDEQLAKAKDSELSLREKDEQIKDLMSEMKILHQHNAELIALSSKYSQVQEANAELKRKISEQLLDHQSLKSAFSNEKANIIALQAANEQLVGKLHELQRNIDYMTIQLKTLEAQNEKLASVSELRIVRTVERETNTNSLPENVAESPKLYFDRKTEKDSSERLRDASREEMRENSAKRVGPQSPMRADRSFQPDNGSASLMPEEMLKLLDQAQINTPQNLPKEYSNSSELGQKQREYCAKSPRDDNSEISIIRPRAGYENSETCVTRSPHGFENSEICLTRPLHGFSKIAATSHSNCTVGKMCSPKDGCGSLCARSMYKEEQGGLDNKFECCQRDFSHNSFRNLVSDIGSCIQKAFDNIHMSRLMRVDGTLDDSYKSWQPCNAIENSRTGSLNEQQSVGCGEAVRFLNKLKSRFATQFTQGTAATPRGSLVNDAPKNKSSQRDSMVDSFLSTSVGQSDSSVTPSTEDEDATSEDLRRKPRISSMKRLLKNVKETTTEEDTVKIDSESVNEFNSFLRNNTTSSPQGSSSSVQDLGHVFSDENWHEYKKRSMNGQASTSRSLKTIIADKSIAHQSADKTSRIEISVIIRIESLSLDEDCPLLEDSQVQRLYVEFSFLGYHGANLETISVKKPNANTTVYFNYTKKFEIDEDEHQVQRSILRAMMTDDDNPVVKFIVVSEPLPSEMETKECLEVGYAYFNIRDYVLSGQSNEVSMTILDARQSDPIGSLKISLVGTEAIRRCMSGPA